ncbi:hypothetical protein V6N13_090741 [Hibiscus sabdariffa]|uniref:Uncharacterized protein n=2 Tax=Hibiscus sabdariffa TaxID=183260 RepID=A0ABR1Z8X5_9ROSI
MVYARTRSVLLTWAFSAPVTGCCCQATRPLRYDICYRQNPKHKFKFMDIISRRKKKVRRITIIIAFKGNKANYANLIKKKEKKIHFISF